VAKIVAIALGPRGERLVAATAGGRVLCFDQRGDLVWRQKIPDVDRVLTSHGGELTLAYAVRQPLAREVNFIDSQGHRFARLRISEPVRTAILLDNGMRAAIAAGKSVVFCSRGAQGLRCRVVRLPAVPKQLQFGPGESVYAACESPESLLLVKSNGQIVWRRVVAAQTRPTLSASSDGLLLAIGSQNGNGQVRLTLVTEQNHSLWSLERPGRYPRVKLSADGKTVLFAYEHRLEHQEAERFEQRLGYFPSGERGSWTKGGAFTAPLGLTLARDGEWVVALDTQQAGAPRFRLFDRDGKSRYAHACPASLLIATAASEGRHIAAYRTDGVIQVLEVRPQ
jgi:hypothetical protein